MKRDVKPVAFAAVAAFAAVVIGFVAGSVAAALLR